MLMNFWKRSGVVLLAGALALAGCSGDDGPKGDPGQQGDPGAPGEQGEPGLSSGTLTGVVTSQAGDVLPGITVTTDPLALSATTGADGKYSIADVPAGVYAVTFAGTNVAAKTVSGVAMLAGQSITKDATLTYSPIKITFAAPASPIFPVGFAKAVEVDANVTGATGALTYTWTLTGPTAAAITADAADASKASFTTGTIAAMAAGGKVRNWRIAPRKGLVAISNGQTANMSYVAKLVVSDGKYEQTASLTVPSSMATAGSPSTPVGVPVIANDVAATNAWTLEKPSGSTSVLEGAATANPSFIPDIPGQYTLKNGASDATPIVVMAATWTGSSESCGGCHTLLPQARLDNVAAKFREWSNSAHGNHYWRFMEYDAAGALVWKKDAAGNPLPAPTTLVDAKGNPVFWVEPGRMTLPQFGLSNGEGSHYGESCIGCHAVGFNKLVSNGGFDDQVGADGKPYAYPGSLLHDGGSITAPDPAAWNAIPAGSRARAGIQCESCHGPLGEHRANADPFSMPRSFFDAETCGVCHDRAAKHDRYQLWAQGGHANLELALEEGPNANCGRCHSAQGFIAWASMTDPVTGAPTPFALRNLDAAPAAATVQPITCMACHDPHTTGLREVESVAITSGFTVTGAGAGQLCVVCHSSRRGLRNDGVTLTTSNAYSLPHASAQSDMFFGQNAFFIPVAELDGGTTISKHAYVLEGTCVSCHMEPGTAFEGLTIAGVVGAMPQVTNHSFKVNTNVCGKCHESAAFEATKTAVEAKLAEVIGMWEVDAKAAIPATYVITLSATNTTPAPATVGAATFTTAPDSVALGAAGQHGMAITLRWNAPITVTIGGNPVTVGDATSGATVGVALNAVKAADGTTNVFAPTSTLVKAYWNIGLIEEDQSFGGHNPPFAQRVIAATKGALAP